jgi:hypothetical protein
MLHRPGQASWNSPRDMEASPEVSKGGSFTLRWPSSNAREVFPAWYTILAARHLEFASRWSGICFSQPISRILTTAGGSMRAFGSSGVFDSTKRCSCFTTGARDEATKGSSGAMKEGKLMEETGA